MVDSSRTYFFVASFDSFATSTTSMSRVTYLLAAENQSGESQIDPQRSLPNELIGHDTA